MKIIKNELHKNKNLLDEYPELKSILDIIQDDIEECSLAYSSCFKNITKTCNTLHWECKWKHSSFYFGKKFKTFFKNYSFAYFSEWGTGKTSRLVDLCENHLNINPIQISLWKFAKFYESKKESVAEHIINEIISILVNYEDHKVFNKMQSKNKASKISVKGFKFESGENIVNTIPKSIAEKSWLLKQQIIYHLKQQKNSNPLIIIFDDLDRVNAGLIIPLLDTIRNFLDINGVITIVPIDDYKLIESLKESKDKNISNNFIRFISKYFSYTIKASNKPIIDPNIILKSIECDDDIDKEQIFPIIIENFSLITYRIAKDILNRLTFNLNALKITKNNDNFIDKVKLMLYATIIQIQHPLFYKEFSDPEKGFDLIKKLIDLEDLPEEYKEKTEEDQVEKYLIAWEKLKINIASSTLFKEIKFEKSEIQKIFWQYITLSNDSGQLFADHSRYIDTLNKIKENNITEIKEPETLNKLYEHSYIKNGYRESQVTFANYILKNNLHIDYTPDFYKTLFEQADFSEEKDMDHAYNIVFKVGATFEEAMEKFGIKLLPKFLQQNEINLTNYNFKEEHNFGKDELNFIKGTNVLWLDNNNINFDKQSIIIEIDDENDFNAIIQHIKNMGGNYNYGLIKWNKKFVIKSSEEIVAFIISNIMQYNEVKEYTEKWLIDLLYIFEIKECKLAIINGLKENLNLFNQLPNDLKIKLVNDLIMLDEFTDSNSPTGLNIFNMINWEGTKINPNPYRKKLSKMEN